MPAFLKYHFYVIILGWHLITTNQFWNFTMGSEKEKKLIHIPAVIVNGINCNFKLMRAKRAFVQFLSISITLILLLFYTKYPNKFWTVILK